MFFARHPSFILVVGDEGTMMMPHGDETIAPLFAASHDEAGKRDILNCLQRYPKSPVFILANGASQDFRIETLPPLNPIDRFKLVRRRLRQAFPQAYATASRSIDRTHVLLAGLMQSGAIMAWLVALPPERVTLGLLPVECACLVAELEPQAKKGWAILIAPFRTGGLRQIVTSDGELIFTRQTRAASHDGVDRAIADSRGYLSRFGLTEDQELRTVYASEKGETCDELFAAMVATRGKLRLPILPPAIKQRQQHAAIARWGMRAASIILIVGLGMVGWGAARCAAQFAANYRASHDIAALREQLIAEEASLAPSNEPVGRLRAALERQRLFSEMQPQPYDLLRELGGELQGKARLTYLDWRDGSLRVDLRLEQHADANDRESIIHAFGNLAEELSHAMPDYDIAVTRYPFPALPQETLTNAASEKSADTPTAELTIRRRS